MNGTERNGTDDTAEAASAETGLLDLPLAVLSCIASLLVPTSSIHSFSRSHRRLAKAAADDVLVYRRICEVRWTATTPSNWRPPGGTFEAAWHSLAAVEHLADSFFKTVERDEAESILYFFSWAADAMNGVQLVLNGTSLTATRCLRLGPPGSGRSPIVAIDVDRFAVQFSTAGAAGRSPLPPNRGPASFEESFLMFLKSRSSPGSGRRTRGLLAPTTTARYFMRVGRMTPPGVSHTLQGLWRCVSHPRGEGEVVALNSALHPAPPGWVAACRVLGPPPRGEIIWRAPEAPAGDGSPLNSRLLAARSELLVANAAAGAGDGSDEDEDEGPPLAIPEVAAVYPCQACRETGGEWAPAHLFFCAGGMRVGILQGEGLLHSGDDNDANDIDEAVESGALQLTEYVRVTAGDCLA